MVVYLILCGNFTPPPSPNIFNIIDMNFLFIEIYDSENHIIIWKIINTLFYEQNYIQNDMLHIFK